VSSVPIRDEICFLRKAEEGVLPDDECDGLSRNVHHGDTEARRAATSIETQRKSDQAARYGGQRRIDRQRAVVGGRVGRSPGGMFAFERFSFARSASLRAGLRRKELSSSALLRHD